MTAAKTPQELRTFAAANANPGVRLVAPQPLPELKADLNGIVHLLTCGSVDDGKSTLIGRLLWDASDLYDDQRATIERSVGGDGLPDLSLLVDGLVAEREQGITIDIAWRYFDTAKRRFVVIDSPGHEQYTRNMASGASHADVALMLVDARHGLKRQTLRHAAILDLVGVKRVVLAVNKMDLVDWSEQKFAEIALDFEALRDRFGFRDAIAIPLAAKPGDNVARRSAAMPWYEGPTLLDYLDAVPGRGSTSEAAFRLPVQTVLRGGQDFRGLAGTVSSGSIRVGGTLRDVATGRSARVKRIATMDRDLDVATAGRAVVLQLDTDIDVSRGAVLAGVDAPPVLATSIDAHLVWLSDAPLDTDHGLLFRSATDLAPVAAIEITARLDLETLTQHPGAVCTTNDIALATIALGRPVALDAFTDHTETGSFVLIDALSGATVAGGVVKAARSRESASAKSTFKLTRAALVRGVCADLGADAGSGREFRRRAEEVAILLRSAGVTVDLEACE